VKIGAMNNPAQDPITEIEWFGAHDFDFVDLTLEPPAADPDDLDIAGVRAALERHHLEVVGHAAYYIPISSPFASLRRAALQECQRALEMADQVGARMMTVHYLHIPPLFPPERVPEWHIDVLGPLCERAAQLGMTVLLENAPGGPGQIDHIAHILDALPSLGFHLDAGHTQVEGGSDLFQDYLERLSPRLMHVHLSENDGRYDQHLPLGAVPKVHLDWPARIGRLKACAYDGTISLEVFAPERAYLLQSRDLLRRWWGEETD
jgi:sugar phosphate isomerase/epimerase